MTRPTLIIGAGIAGLWAALKAAPRPVILVTGAPLGDGAASCWAQGGVAAALAEDDTPGLHAADTITAGAGLVTAKAAHALAEGAADEVRELAGIGAPFEREGDTWSLSREAAHSRHRVARVKGDGAGAAIMEALITAVRAADHIDLREGWKATALLPKTAGICRGAQVKTPANELINIESENTILAMGGAGGLFALTTTPAGAQGQAMVMAARVGATVQDPEFVQFHPTALNAGLDPAPLCTEALRGEGATLVDRTGHRFMKSIHPDGELAPRDVVARAVHRQNQSGKNAFLDCTEAVGDAFPKRFPAVFAACMRAGIDPRTQPIPVAPTAHYHMGGVKTDIDGRTNIAGLWAIGECASTGLHGANRLASNSLAEGLVAAARCVAVIRAFLPPQAGEVAEPQARPMGASAVGTGKDKCELATVNRDRQHAPLPPLRATFPVNGEGLAAPQLPPLALQRLRQAMSQHCGVERNLTGLSRLKELIEDLIDNHGDADALIAARFIVEGALRRTESRGGHFRTDYPQPDDMARHTRLRWADLQAIADVPIATTCPAE
jgi:L-aspartate oxidase